MIGMSAIMLLVTVVCLADRPELFQFPRIIQLHTQIPTHESGFSARPIAFMVLMKLLSCLAHDSDGDNSDGDDGRIAKVDAINNSAP